VQYYVLSTTRSKCFIEEEISDDFSRCTKNFPAMEEWMTSLEIDFSSLYLRLMGNCSKVPDIISCVPIPGVTHIYSSRVVDILQKNFPNEVDVIEVEVVAKTNLKMYVFWPKTNFGLEAFDLAQSEIMVYPKYPDSTCGWINISSAVFSEEAVGSSSIFGLRPRINGLFRLIVSQTVREVFERNKLSGFYYWEKNQKSGRDNLIRVPGQPVRAP